MDVELAILVLGAVIFFGALISASAKLCVFCKLFYKKQLWMESGSRRFYGLCRINT
jgi:hypothetical protein